MAPDRSEAGRLEVVEGERGDEPSLAVDTRPTQAPTAALLVELC